MADTNLAIALTEAAEQSVAQRLCDRIIQHLADRLERELREGLAMRPPSSEQVALSILRGTADELRAASQALAAAAHTLKESGKALPANRAHQASQRALKAAEELIGA